MLIKQWHHLATFRSANSGFTYWRVGNTFIHPLFFCSARSLRLTSCLCWAQKYNSCAMYFNKALFFFKAESKRTFYESSHWSIFNNLLKKKRYKKTKNTVLDKGWKCEQAEMVRSCHHRCGLGLYMVAIWKCCNIKSAAKHKVLLIIFIHFI